MDRPVQTPLRKKLHRIEVPGHVRYLTCSCYRRAALFDDSGARDMFAAQLETVRRTLGFRLYAWVLMPEHFHLLLLPNLPEAHVPRILHALKQPLARRLGRRLWQPGGGYDRNIYSNDELFEKARCIEFNPVRRGLVRLAEDWPWSSARRHREDESGPVTIDPMPR